MNLFDDVLGRMVESGEIHPDGAEHIRGMGWGGRLPPADALGRLFDHLEGPGPDARAANPLLRSGDVATPGLRARGPNYSADDGRSPLRKMLDRFSLAVGAAEHLEAEWAFSIGRDTPGRMAAAIARRLGDRANHRHLADPPPRPASEQRVLDVVNSRFYGEVPTDRREAVAAKLSREFGGILDENLLVEKIADRLSHQASADHYGTRTVPRDDPRLRAVSVAKREESQAQKRGQDGRFVETSLHGHNPF